MNDPGKYVRLFWLLLASATAFIIVFVLLFLGVRLLFGLVNDLPWITYIYTLGVLSVPPAVFITAFTVFLNRTRSHPSKTARIVSYILLGLFLCAWIFSYVTDIIAFFRTVRPQILEYNSWHMVFLAASVACLFIVGVIQALSYPKEEDWLERRKRLDNDY